MEIGERNGDTFQVFHEGKELDVRVSWELEGVEHPFASGRTHYVEMPTVHEVVEFKGDDAYDYFPSKEELQELTELIADNR